MNQKLENAKIDGYVPRFAKQSDIGTGGSDLLKTVRKKDNSTTQILDPEKSQTFQIKTLNSSQRWAIYGRSMGYLWVGGGDPSPMGPRAGHGDPRGA